MEIPDLFVFPPGHPPSPYRVPLLDMPKPGVRVIRVLPGKFELCAVGWLGSEVPSVGRVSKDCIARLNDALESGCRFNEGTMGFHVCEICRTENRPAPERVPGVTYRQDILDNHFQGSGHLLIQHRDYVYMCPSSILHYICVHNYSPPQRFLAAVLSGTILSEANLVISEETFEEWQAKHMVTDCVDGVETKTFVPGFRFREFD